ncbi:MAG: mechanosensitive ion channel family protein [Halobacteriales archaeon]|nr:mechanosensitive ion channel family protein [Halobacteriales archaeon]
MGEQLGSSVFQAGIFVVAFVVLFLVGKIVVSPLVRRVLEKRNLDRHARKPLMKITTFVIVFVALAVAFAVAGFGNLLTSIATIAAAATLAIGLALQNVIRNFVSGVFIYVEKPFKIGDWIEWEDGTYSGIVEDISLRVTRVRTFDNELLTVPNSSLTENVVKNPVDAERLRLKFVFGIGYGDDIGKATDIIIEEAEDHDGIMDDPAPSVRTTELADSYVGLQSRIWIANPSRSDFIRTRSEYVENVKNRFDDEGIEIPFPQRDLSGVIETRRTEGERVE